ncbi:phenylalanine--tRNA ligase subunit beta [Sulfurimonas sp. HSL-1716]|uniref:phenylalanine--tRNA ligase subunit beta n=1 Tax=Hydrocurvibacter sulfurireducens TaxID=3131937 RepID=UPI0031F8292C
MIVTKSWLNEFISIEDKSTEELCKTLNSIGLEVDRVVEYKIPNKIVFGHVLECEKHPDADKLNVCKVDIGTSIRQIVCGAANVRRGLHVAVATVGAEMPGGLKIKPVKLRGVESEGMICSAAELGLADIGGGIIEFDSSIGEFKLGQELCENPYLQDTLIEIELTANRGDCLSIYGVSRDLCAAYSRPLKKIDDAQDQDRRMGIGRVLQFSHTDGLNVNLRYKAIDLKDVKLPFIVTLRLSQVEEKQQSDLDAILFYSTYTTGVILRAYDYNFFKDSEESDKKIKVSLAMNELGYACIYAKEEVASIVGIKQCDVSKMSSNEGLTIIEASYIPPHIISKQMAENKIENGPLFYRTSRGSEPKLNIGLNYFIGMFEEYSQSDIYGGDIELCDEYEDVVVSISVDEINSIIGANIDKTTITKILQNLGFDIGKSQGSSFVVSVPRYRHDIVNKQDIVEEIVRLVGIDNIPSKPFTLREKNPLSSGFFQFKKLRKYRNSAASQGFFETVHFVFNEKAKLKEYGFSCVEESLELLNPIVNTLDTMRPTLMLGLLNAASLNAKSGYKDIRLFEVGSVFSPLREESIKMAFIYSGDADKDGVLNSGKSKKMDFGTFVQSVSNIIGDVALVKHETRHNLANPYQCAKILMNAQEVGEIYKLHPVVQDEFDLDDTFICEIDFDKLSFDLVEAKAYSKYQASFRDLSVLVPNTLSYKDVQEVISQNKTEEIVRFYPVDKYMDEKLGDNASLTIRFVLQSLTKTLEEEDITSTMDTVLNALNEKLGLTLR